MPFARLPIRPEALCRTDPIRVFPSDLVWHLFTLGRADLTVAASSTLLKQPVKQPHLATFDAPWPNASRWNVNLRLGSPSQRRNSPRVGQRWRGGAVICDQLPAGGRAALKTDATAVFDRGGGPCSGDQRFLNGRPSSVRRQSETHKERQQRAGHAYSAIMARVV